MFQNLLKTAFRSLLKNKSFTILNITGLSMGLATFLLITFYIADEFSYDRYNRNADRIYRVNSDVKFGASVSAFAVSPPPLAGALLHNIPEVEKVARFAAAPDFDIRFKKGNENIQEIKVAFADQSIFDIFTLPVIAGDRLHALSEPNSIVLTEKAAKKYFNRTDVVGQVLTLIRPTTYYKITAVIRDIPDQSHFNFDFFISMPSFKPSLSDNWGNFSFNTYVLLKAGTPPQQFEKRVAEMLRGFIGAEDYDEFEKNGSHIRFSLTPLTAIHLQSNRQYELGINSSMENGWLFSGIALLVLVIACINFMNLSTARSANRAREVGVRKVLGSSRRQLVGQFLSESLLVSLFSMAIAVLMAWALLPFFNRLADKNLAITNSNLVGLLALLSLLVAIVGILAGSYPAFFLSGFQPTRVLKGKLSAGLKGGGLRNALVIFQFSISLFLIIGTLIIYNQLRYIRDKDLGFNRTQVMVIKNVQSIGNAETFKQEIRQLPEVEDASLSGFLPTGNLRNPGAVYTQPSTEDKDALLSEIWRVDEDYVPTMGMSLKKGRNFSTRFMTDSSGILLNETAAKKLGYGNNPLNRKLYIFPDDSGSDTSRTAKEYRVIGLLKDFNFSSLRDNISPVFMILGRSNNALSLRINAKQPKSFIAGIERKWNALSPHQRLDYSFMDADFDAAYRSDQRVGKLFLSFTALAIGIACLGLFGLVNYAAEQRRREIGIRKILGATVTTITVLLSKEFLKLVLLSIVIATPIAWLAMNKWLQGFAYRAPLPGWAICLAGIFAVFIAGLTIGFQTLKAAMANPVDSLRSE